MGLESYNICEKGFTPFLVDDGWQVAQLNYIATQHIDKIDKVEVHQQTDEVFILLEGKATLIVLNKDDKLSFSAHIMLPQVTYNIPKGLWHNIAMEKGSKVLIVEKSNTHLNDVEYFYLTKKQISDLRYEIDKLKEL
ncbi:hypothetical protein [Aestuariivivens sp. NBU2969]|uniref:hypothetical protein n=1 Tax=Aestuariivivens sp. NBU2969 TaxID=2873267 RepID=UPI001CC0AC3E|nr:hypothetical protein [Aestuariivivens sp. NBU2969]